MYHIYTLIVFAVFTLTNSTTCMEQPQQNKELSVEQIIAIAEKNPAHEENNKKIKELISSLKNDINTVDRERQKDLKMFFTSNAMTSLMYFSPAYLLHNWNCSSFLWNNPYLALLLCNCDIFDYLSKSLKYRSLEPLNELLDKPEELCNRAPLFNAMYNEPEAEKLNNLIACYKRKEELALNKKNN